MPTCVVPMVPERAKVRDTNLFLVRIIKSTGIAPRG